MVGKTRGGMATAPVVFLFDVDNTLLDNDRVTADLKQHLTHEVGPERQQRYWAIYEQLRAELGYADYLGALQRYRTEYPRDPRLLTVSRSRVAVMRSRRHSGCWAPSPASTRTRFRSW